MFNNFDKFTKEAKRALIVAQDQARDVGLSYVGTEHILLGILTQPESLGASVLLGFGVTVENVKLVLQTVGRANSTKTSSGESGSLSGFAKKVIEDAIRTAYRFNHSAVGTEHLLYALVSQENTAATVILENMKIRPAEVRKQIEEVFRDATEAQSIPKNVHPLEILFGSLQQVISRQNSQQDFGDSFAHKDGSDKVGQSAGSASRKKSKTPALDYFTTDLTAEARAGKLDPVIGRETEISRMVAILNRKTKNNPVLTGESGVGKTAVVEGLAQAIVAEKVPASMLDRRVLMISMTSLVAGTKYRGEFEDRFKKIIDEATKFSNEVILFLDELHTVIGTGAAEGSLDAANILKPALARGKIQVIGATTIDEFRKHVEGDKALARRFQPVIVPEPSEEDSIKILEGLRSSFEKHHGLKIDDTAILAAVKMSKRYVPDRFLPDKAIDLIDEAASLKGVRQRGDSVTIKKLKAELTKIISEKEAAVSNQSYEIAANLRARELQIRNEIEATKSSTTLKNSNQEEITVTSEDVAKVVASSTGVPTGDLLSEDVIRLKDLEKILATRIIGQKVAVKSVAQAVRRSRVGIAAPNRPIGSFIFLGPTGVGKTELVKTLAREVYGSEDALIKIDMSEFAERHSSSRLVGASAGYIGYEEGGELTEKVRRRPYSVVLFDEVEKAHHDFQNLLLQILEDGYLTDARGRRTDFRNTIIVMTSNIGAERMTTQAGKIGFAVGSELRDAKAEFEELKTDVLNKLEESFRPEFLNRVDKVVVFEPLTSDEIKEIVKLHLKDLEERLREKKIKLELNAAALTYLAEKSYNPKYGARPVRRAITEKIEDELAGLLLDGKFKNGDTVLIGFDKKAGELSFRKKTKTRSKM
ncbi:ATP-dependent Clp protease ATP-binding subunit [Candidatus Gracilibacteria bacterium]|nr:ATP-dependent Clp protease ATP-binding subunit [Candidatus Gracilibacteria bacterium]MCF7856475.1 ATP-dependent Clp protease ATP-binding subunit [Candidatus Gracilibacteria bacterium]MCF7896771.1 ATP-dependent Clp protease ATP-binding subunit [Candidatus Gracilibacteria bacterium]